MDASLNTEVRNRNDSGDSAPSAVAGLSIAIAGSGGSGVMTAGTLLLEAAAQAGLYGLMVRTSGPQIRGGEAAALLRLGATPLESLDDRFDLLLAIDWQNVHRFADEIPLHAGSLVIGDADGGEVPEVFLRTGAQGGDAAAEEDGQGTAGQLDQHAGAGPGRRARRPRQLPRSKPRVRSSWKRPEAALLANLSALHEGMAAAQGPSRPVEPERRRGAPTQAGAGCSAATRPRASAHCAAAFVSSPPIRSRRPPSCSSGWRRRCTKVGGSLLQAEDELASVNMIIGASYGGVPSLTATAGPGLALMTEGIGLAVAAEVPIVVVDVMRGGPSTGIPAKSEQSDLSFAVSGLHGDAPRLVLAPSSISDCVATTQWAVELAEALQAPGDRAVGPVHGPVARHHRPARDARRLGASA